MMQFVKTTCAADSQTDCKDHKWFENGWNKVCY